MHFRWSGCLAIRNGGITKKLSANSPVALHVEQHLHGCAQYDRPAYISAAYRLWLRALRVSWKKHPLHADACNLDGANTHKVYSTLLDVPAVGPNRHLLPIILPEFFGHPFFIFLMTQYMRSIPKELDEAARLDGAGSFTSPVPGHSSTMQTGTCSDSSFSFVELERVHGAIDFSGRF